MKDYRLYMLNNAGRFVGVVELSAPEDKEAIAAARARRDGVAMELWRRDQLVETFQPKLEAAG